MVQARPSLPLYSFKDIAHGDASGVGAETAAPLRTMVDWTRSFLMAAHPELGRQGDVCPFTARGSRLDTLRYGVSSASGADVEQIRQQMLQAFDAFDAIAHPPRMGHFRAVMVAFPHCADPAGLAALMTVQRNLRFQALRRDRMVGLFHDGTEAVGLWNPAFRPLRSPIPLLAIRLLVENDAAFALRHAMLIPAYLRRFKFAGGRRLVSLWLRQA